MLEKLGVKTGLMPTGGWRYEQPLPAGGVQRIPASGCAGTDDELVKQVKLFRVNANIDLGDVPADVAAYIRRESPMNDRFPGRVYERNVLATQAANGFRPYIDRIKDWLLQVSAKRPRLLIEDSADERAAACMGCPHNVPWKTGCLPCVEAVESRAMNVRQRASWKHDKDVGACRLHDFHISTAAFIDRDDLPPISLNAPEICWMYKPA